MRDIDSRYFETLETRLETAVERAQKAKQKGYDPTPDVEIPIARDMADRVENILNIPGVADRVRELDETHTREEAALELVTDFVDGTVGEFDSREGKIEGAVRTAVALLTEGVVAAPIEGIDRIEILTDDDGTEFVNVYYAGPIRSAGGTAQALSVLVADYARSLLGIDEYRARDDEVERFVEEIGLYDRETGLQYSPKDEETRFIAEHLPIMLDGEPTGDEEVSGYRDLDRIDSNATRGGMCLVLAEGIALKAPKIQRYTSQLAEVEWPWLQELIDGVGAHAETDTSAEQPSETESDTSAPSEGAPRASTSTKYLRDLIAGRPVFSHPSRPGGFRLRYGRARNHGFATAGIHPATMHLFDDFLATGTQIKTEHPGKAAGIVPVDSIEGPTVRLATGEVRHIDDPAEAREVRNGVEEVIDVGEYLVNYGEFVENNQDLAPAAYTTEWWIQEFEDAGGPVQALSDDPDVELDSPSVARAIEWATSYECPLHPAYTYLWHDVSVEACLALADAIDAGSIETVETDGGTLQSHHDSEQTVLRVEYDADIAKTLEHLLLEHHQHDKRIDIFEYRAVLASLGFDADGTREWTNESVPAMARTYDHGASAIKLVNWAAEFSIRERAPTRIGNRMGRPEKSEKRELSPAVHTLFPIGEAGGNQRDVTAAASDREATGDRGIVNVQLNERLCPSCQTETYRLRCPDCETHTEIVYRCDECDHIREPDDAGRVYCDHCEQTVTASSWVELDLGTRYRDALDTVGVREAGFDILKGVKGLTSADSVGEPLEKGILRARNDVSAFKDGTIRYDMTDLPVTAVKPAELGVTAERFRELGYQTDIDGEPLTFDDQLVELKIQDIVLSDGAAEHMCKTADFVDDLLVNLYDEPPFYEVTDRDDLIGELVFGMAPHTSAAVIGRVVGFTSAAVGYAHPYFHAAKRRNCFHPETRIWYQNTENRWQHRPIREVVESHLHDPRVDDVGTQIQELEADLYVPSINANGEETLQRIEAVSKHQAPAHLVRIETHSGREITLTPDHDMHTFDDGHIASTRASELTTGDQAVIPTKLESVSPSGQTPEFDLLNECIEDDSISLTQVTLHTTDGASDREREDLSASSLVSFVERTRECRETTTDTQNGVVSLEEILSVDHLTADKLVRLPAETQIGSPGEDITMNKQLEIDADLAFVLGCYATAGSIQHGTDTGYDNGDSDVVTIFETTKPEVRRSIIRTLAKLGIETYNETESHLVIPGRILKLLFETVLDAGRCASQKHVPRAMFDAPDAVVRSYLNGCFDVTGVSESTDALTTCTSSRALKEDILALSRRIGMSTCVTCADTAGGSPKGKPVRQYRLFGCTGEHAHRRECRVCESAHISGYPQSAVVDGGCDTYRVDPIATVEYIEADTAYTYDLTVASTHSLIANDLSQKQCDGDEDCVMLLMDGLLNFSKSYLPDKRGGSVAEDSRLVAVGPQGDVHFFTFDAFWETLECPVKHDGKFVKKLCLGSGWDTYAFNANHEASLKPIEKAIRYQADADESLIEIETAFGRSLTLTEHHSLFRYENGIEEVAGAAIEPGDLVVAPQQLDVETTDTAIDLRAVGQEDVSSVREQSIRDGVTVNVASDGGRFTDTEQIYKNVEPKNQPALSQADAEATSTKESPLSGEDRYIPVDDSFAWLLGVCMNEGSMDAGQATITTTESECRTQVCHAVESLRGVYPEVQSSTGVYTIELPTLFGDILRDLGVLTELNTQTAAIPDCILRAGRPVVSAFLRGFAGVTTSNQANRSRSTPTHTLQTTDEQLKDGLVFLCHRLGIVADIEVDTAIDDEATQYRVTVSGLLDETLTASASSKHVPIPEAVFEIREMDIEGIEQLIPRSLRGESNQYEQISLERLETIVETLDQREIPNEATAAVESIRPLVESDLSYLRVEAVEAVEYDGYLYDLQVGGEPVFTANWLYAHNSMDAPLVMSSRIDPTEIDDEAHNMDIVEQYPKEFYEATRTLSEPEAVEDLITLGADTLETADAYHGFNHTHDTSDIALGPDLSAYKTLGSMMEKMDAQLALARKLRAVDETDVAERVIEYHFLPDLIGNLRAFSRQETRCLDCGKKYRRMPLTGECRECGGRVNLTVHEGSVNKYMETAIHVAEEFDCREYTKQRLEVLEKSISSVFEDDKNKQSGFADFM